MSNVIQKYLLNLLNVNIQKLVFKAEYETCLSINHGCANFTRITGAGQKYCDKTNLS